MEEKIMNKVTKIDSKRLLFCRYINPTYCSQVIRLVNHNPSFEKTIASGQKIEFKAPPEAYLEVRDSEFCGHLTSIYDSPIYCHELAISENQLEPIAA